MSKHGNEQPVGIFRIDLDVRDHLRIAQSKVNPSLACVGRFVHAIADGKVGPDNSRSCADVNDVGVRWRNGDRTDRPSGRLVVEERHSMSSR